MSAPVNGNRGKMANGRIPPDSGVEPAPDVAETHRQLALTAAEFERVSSRASIYSQQSDVSSTGTHSMKRRIDRQKHRSTPGETPSRAQGDRGHSSSRQGKDPDSQRTDESRRSRSASRQSSRQPSSRQTAADTSQQVSNNNKSSGRSVDKTHLSPEDALRRNRSKSHSRPSHGTQSEGEKSRSEGQKSRSEGQKSRSEGEKGRSQSRPRNSSQADGKDISNSRSKSRSSHHSERLSIQGQPRSKSTPSKHRDPLKNPSEQGDTPHKRTPSIQCDTPHKTPSTLPSVRVEDMSSVVDENSQKTGKLKNGRTKSIVSVYTDEEESSVSRNRNRSRNRNDSLQSTTIVSVYDDSVEQNHLPPPPPRRSASALAHPKDTSGRPKYSSQLSFERPQSEMVRHLHPERNRSFLKLKKREKQPSPEQDSYQEHSELTTEPLKIDSRLLLRMVSKVNEERYNSVPLAKRTQSLQSLPPCGWRSESKPDLVIAMSNWEKLHQETRRERALLSKMEKQRQTLRPVISEPNLLDDRLHLAGLQGQFVEADTLNMVKTEKFRSAAHSMMVLSLINLDNQPTVDITAPVTPKSIFQNASKKIILANRVQKQTMMKKLYTPLVIAMDMSNVSEEERRRIKSVLKRDEQLLRTEAERIAKLRLDFQQFKRQSAFRSGNQGNRVCARCHEKLGLIFNRGALCPKCQHKVCSKCRQSTPLNPKSWVCLLCFKQARLKLYSGDWFYENVQTRFQHRYLHGSDVLRSSFRKRGHQCHHRSHHKFSSVSLENVPEIVDGETGAYSSEESTTVSNAASHVTPDQEMSDRSSIISLDYDKVAFPQEDDRELLHILVSNKHSPKIISSPGSLHRAADSAAATGVVTDSDSTRSSGSPTTRRARRVKCDEMRRNVSWRRCQQTDAAAITRFDDIKQDPRPRSRDQRHPHPRMRRQDELRNEHSAVHSDSSSATSSHRTSPAKDPRFLSPDKIPRDGRRHSPRNHRRSASGGALVDLEQRNNETLSRDIDTSPSVRRKTAPQTKPHPKNSPLTKPKNSPLKPHPSPAASPVIPQANLSSDMNRSVTRLLDLAGRGDSDTTSDIESIQSDPPCSNDLVNTNNNTIDPEETEHNSENDEGVEADSTVSSAASNFIFKRLSKQSVKKHRERIKRMTGQPSLTSLGNDTDIDSYVNQFTTEGQDDEGTKEEGEATDETQQQTTLPESMSEQEQIEQCNKCKETATDEVEPAVPRPAIILELAIDTEADMLKKHNSGNGSVYSSDQGYDESQALMDRLQSDHSTAGSDTNADPTQLNKMLAPRNRSRVDSTGHLAVSLYGSRESLDSVYSNAGEHRRGHIQITGEMMVSLQYCFKTSFFKVYIKQCKDLAPVDTRRMRSDSYAKSYLLPDKTKNGKRKTKVKKNTLNPHFEETLKYCLTRGELETRTLWISVWNSDSLGHNDFLGEIRIPMETWHVDDSALKWHPLRDRCEPPDSLIVYKGDLRIAIRYSKVENETKSKKKKIVEKGVLQVRVIEAMNLTPLDVSGTSDAFVKGYFLPEKSKGMKQKTPVIKKDCNPKWNYEFQFEGIQFEELAERCLELTVWDYDRITHNDFLGGVRLNLGRGKSYERSIAWMDAQGEEMNLWRALIEQPNQWVEGRIPLRDSMVSHFKK